MSWTLRERPRDPDAELLLSAREEAEEAAELTLEEILAIELRKAAVARLKRERGEGPIGRRRLDTAVAPVSGRGRNWRAAAS